MKNLSLKRHMVLREIVRLKSVILDMKVTAYLAISISHIHCTYMFMVKLARRPHAQLQQVINKSFAPKLYFAFEK
jgi:hypothetical protein